MTGTLASKPIPGLVSDMRRVATGKRPPDGVTKSRFAGILLIFCCWRKGESE